jgi:hypothetical protein
MVLPRADVTIMADPTASAAGKFCKLAHRIPASFFALPKISSSIAGVNLPVNIFCWLG